MTATLLADAIGWAGAVCLLLAYARLSSGQLTADTRYHLLNLAGASGLVIDGTFRHAWPSAALNLIWLGIGLTALRRAKRSKVQQTSDHPGRGRSQSSEVRTR